MKKEQAKKIIKELGDDESLVQWCNDDEAEVDEQGDIWFNNHWGNKDELVAYALWLENQ